MPNRSLSSFKDTNKSRTKTCLLAFCRAGSILGKAKIRISQERKPACLHFAEREYSGTGRDEKIIRKSEKNVTFVIKLNAFSQKYPSAFGWLPEPRGRSLSGGGRTHPAGAGRALQVAVRVRSSGSAAANRIEKRSGHACG